MQSQIAQAMPIAKKWLFSQKEMSFDELREKFEKISSIEVILYGSIKETLVTHILRHGLDAKSLELFEKFKNCKDYDKNCYQQILKNVRKEFVLDPENRSLEYLISKITEYLEKTRALGKTIFKMLEDGKDPDLQAWMKEMVTNDRLFEENKQFLKQTLHHLEVLEQNDVPIGLPELRLLLYNKQGCKREKFYHHVEKWLVRIYNRLQTEEEKKLACEEICHFVADIVPQVGYISPSVIEFILSGGYISQTTRDLFINIQPIIRKLGMTPLVVSPLENYLKTAISHYESEMVTETDRFVMDIMMIYDARKTMDLFSKL